jgi:hypothetical protein
MTAIKYRYEDVDGLKVFYREAGHATASALLLLHGFPSGSHMFRDLIPLLADRFHIIAPDLPGFGQSEMPARSKFSYTFDNIAGVIDRFTEVVGLKRFAIYVFDARRRGSGSPQSIRTASRQSSPRTAMPTTTKATSRSTRLSRPTSAPTSRRSLPCGARTIRSSCRAARIQARHPRSSCPVFRHRALRAGNAYRGDRGSHRRLPRTLIQRSGEPPCVQLS